MGTSGTARKKNQKKVSNNIQMMQNRQDIDNIPNKQKEKSIIYEKDTGNAKMISLDIINKLKKSFCKISYKNNINGVGFFIILNNSFKCIMTNYHVLSENLINNIINIQLYNNKNINILLYNRDIKFYNNLDITIIEIKESDGIIKDINFLDYDLNYIRGYEQYLNIDIFTLQNLREKGISTLSGNIKSIYNKFEFIHNINTENISSGSPIILIDNLKVIGIHKGGDKNKKLSYGSFIGEIFNENINLIENNYIIGEIYISEKNIGENIRIINSYEEYCRDLHFKIEEEYKN